MGSSCTKPMSQISKILLHLLENHVAKSLPGNCRELTRIFDQEMELRVVDLGMI
jgi:hypothetical protein